jgi:hypothetical protein
MSHKTISLQRLGLAALCLVFASAAARVSAAPIDITARLNPGQAGPVYAWSLTLRFDPGYEVGAVDLMTSGFDSMVLNPENLAIDPGLSPFVVNPNDDGRNAVLVTNTANGVSLAEAGVETLLATLYSHSSTSPPILLWDSVLEFGSPAFDPYLRERAPEDVGLSAYPLAVIRLTAIPEPSHFGLVLLALALVAGLSLRTARRRAA